MFININRFPIFFCRFSIFVVLVFAGASFFFLQFLGILATLFSVFFFSFILSRCSHSRELYSITVDDSFLMHACFRYLVSPRLCTNVNREKKTKQRMLF